MCPNARAGRGDDVTRLSLITWLQGKCVSISSTSSFSRTGGIFLFFFSNHELRKTLKLLTKVCRLQCPNCAQSITEGWQKVTGRYLLAMGSYEPQTVMQCNAENRNSRRRNAVLCKDELSSSYFGTVPESQNEGNLPVLQNTPVPEWGSREIVIRSLRFIMGIRGILFVFVNSFDTAQELSDTAFVNGIFKMTFGILSGTWSA